MKQKLLKNKQIILIVIQIFVCICCFAGYRKEHTVYDFTGENIVSDHVLLNNFMESQKDGYYIDSTMEAETDFASTPQINLGRGQYKIVLHYQTDSGSNAYHITADNADFREMLGNYHKTLSPDRTTYTTDLWISRELKNFEVQFDYGGESYFFVSQVEIMQTGNRMIGWGVLLLVAFLCFDYCFLFQDKWKKKLADREWKNRMLILGMIVMFSMLPLLSPYLMDGYDLKFHLTRIEGIKDGLQSGQFPVRMQPNWMNGYGYGTSLFYGDILLYVPALLRLFGCSVQTAYKWFISFINVLSAGIAYYSFKRIFGSEKLGLLGCMLYTTSIYRINCLYIRTTLGEYCASIFLPLILTAVYEILWHEEADKIPRDSWIIGVAGFSGVILTHIISTELTVLFILVLSIVFWKRTFRKETIKEYLKIATGTFVCTLWFILPFLDMWSGEYWFNAEESASYFMQTQGVFINQLLNLFPYVAGETREYSIIEGLAIRNELSFAIGGGLLAGILLFILYGINYGKKTDKNFRRGIGLLVTGGILTYMMTIYFPWDDLQNLHNILYFMIKNIQFPWRLFGLTTLILTMLACLSIQLFHHLDKNKGQEAYILILIFAVISSGSLIGSIISNNEVLYLHNEDDLTTYDTGAGEYLPANANISVTREVLQAVFSEGVQPESVEREYQKFYIVCSNQTEKEGYIDLPLFYYKGYHVKTAEREELTVERNENGGLRVILPEGFEGEIRVNYTGEWYWRAAEIISLIGIIILIYKKFFAQILTNTRRKDKIIEYAAQ